MSDVLYRLGEVALVTFSATYALAYVSAVLSAKYLESTIAVFTESNLVFKSEPQEIICNHKDCQDQEKRNSK